MRLVSLILLTLFLSVNAFSQKKENMGREINSEYSEVNPIISPDGKSIYFVRINHPGNNISAEYNEACWFSTLDENSEWTKAKLMPRQFNLSSTNSILSVSPDGNTFLVRGAYENGKLIAKGFSFIYREKYGWSTPEKLNIKFYEDMNVGEYSGAFLANNGQILIMYFSESLTSNNCDLYFSRLQSNGWWTKPKSLGKSVNGKHTDEISPFLASDGKTLYFSSNRENGYGSYDIYVTKRLGRSWKKWSKPVNIGPNVNTAAWEAYYSLSAKGDYTYMTSTENSIGREDIIRLALSDEESPEPVVLVSGIVRNAKTKELIAATIKYETLPEGELIGTAHSNPQDGKYKITLPYGKKYGITAVLNGYFPVSENIDLSAISEYQEVTKDLEMIPVEIGHTVRMNNIFFDFGKSILNEDSYPELDRVVKLMNDNPYMEIEISGHTDNVGSESFNMKLSADRANAVRDYLIAHKIDGSRITAKGYGKNKPVDTNDTEEGRQKNRRVKGRIIA